MKKVLINVVMNLVMVGLAVLASNWAWQKNLEETLIAIVLIYGLTVVLMNAFFIMYLVKK